jgi:hypothetical protein
LKEEIKEEVIVPIVAQNIINPIVANDNKNVQILSSSPIQ